MLKVQLFGPGRAFYGDQPLVGFPGQQCYLLLCYLLLNREHPHHRERLAAVFWGDYATSTSRKYLRNALWRLRNALESTAAPIDHYLSFDDDCVSFLDPSPTWLDVDVFEQKIADCQDVRGPQLTAEQAAHLEGAVELYTGDLLEGVYEDWCLYDRERLRLLQLSTLGKLMAYYERQGPYEPGLAYGESILAHEPTREKVHRQMMRLYWLMGEQDEALAQYKYCAQILREELGIAPMERTRLLYQQMVRHRFDPASWQIGGDGLSLELPRQNESLQALTGHALQKLQRLQVMAEETRAELNHIERLISQVLASFKGT